MTGTYLDGASAQAWLGVGLEGSDGTWCDRRARSPLGLTAWREFLGLDFVIWRHPSVRPSVRGCAGQPHLQSQPRQPQPGLCGLTLCPVSCTDTGGGWLGDGDTAEPAEASPAVPPAAGTGQRVLGREGWDPTAGPPLWSC